MRIVVFIVIIEKLITMLNKTKDTKTRKYFEPFEKVLVNIFDEDMNSVWTGNIYSHYDEHTNRHYMIDGSWTTEDSLIIPYKGNEDLLGTIVE